MNEELKCDLPTIIASMRNFADVADGCEITHGSAPAAIRAWIDMLQSLHELSGEHVPSYRALHIIARSVAGALERAGITDYDDPGEAIDVMRARYERRERDTARRQVAVAHMLADGMRWDGLQWIKEPQAEKHPDDAAVDRFAVAMKEKLAAARAKGRGGWEDREQCSADDLSDMLREHVVKGDPRDVANFCMMLHQRGESIVQAEQQGAEDALMEAARWHREMNLAGFKGDDWRAEQMLKCPHGRFATALEDALAARQPAGEPVALGAVDPFPCNWSEEDAASLIGLRDSLRGIISGTTAKDAAHFLKQPGQRRMTIKDAQETAAAHLPYVDSLVRRANDYTAPPAAAAVPAPYNAGGIELTACQLHEALLVAGDPEFDTDFEDRGRVRIFYTDTGHGGPGVYCECVGAEEEGCILLDGTSPAIRQPAAPQGVDVAEFRVALSTACTLLSGSYPETAKKLREVSALIDSQHQQQESGDG